MIALKRPDRDVRLDKGRPSLSRARSIPSAETVVRAVAGWQAPCLAQDSLLGEHVGVRADEGSLVEPGGDVGEGLLGFG